MAEKEIDDANMVAFLIFKGFMAIPFIKEEKGEESSSRVAWVIESESERDVTAAMNQYYHNERIGIQDFVRILKDVRGQMYQVKQANNQLKGKK